MQKLFFLLIAIVGLLLMAFMIYTESEPGALPLALVLFGAGGYMVAWVRGRKRRG